MTSMSADTCLSRVACVGPHLLSSLFRLAVADSLKRLPNTRNSAAQPQVGLLSV
jgi:hypothetical protein